MKKEQLECIDAWYSIIGALDSLYDYEYQIKKWCLPTAVHRFWDSIKVPKNTIIEETDLDGYKN